MEDWVEKFRKRHSYRADFKRKVILSSDKIGIRKTAREFSVHESNIRLCRNHRLAIFKCEPTRRNFQKMRAQFPEVEKKVAEFIRERRQSALCVTYDLITKKTREIAKELKIPRRSFKAGIHWVRNVMKRNGFALRRRTSLAQKLPEDFEHKLASYQRYVIDLRKRGNFLLGQIGNADETPIFFDMPSNYTVAEKGAKDVLLKTSGNKKHRVTAMLAVTADGRKLPPFLIFKRKTLPKKTKDEKYPPRIVVRAQVKGWMTEALMIDWLKSVWANRPGAALRLNSMLALDAFRGHLTPDVKDTIRKLQTELVVIPGGMTSVLQPLDVSINKPMKDKVKARYNAWLERDDLKLTLAGKIKRASPFVVAKWIKDAWDEISEDVIARSFKKCCLSNALDGSEDDIIWQSSDEGSDYEEGDDSGSSSSDCSSSGNSAEEQDVTEDEEQDEERLDAVPQVT